MTLHVTEVVLKGIEEFTENFILGLLASLDVWMLLSIVSLSNIIDIKLSRLVRVHDFVCLHGNSFSVRVHLTTDVPEEFIVTDFTTAISVEDRE